MTKGYMGLNGASSMDFQDDLWIKGDMVEAGKDVRQSQWGMMSPEGMVVPSHPVTISLSCPLSQTREA